ncbi:MAG: hypothetical protein GTO20_28125 [Candidatus Aminicenantes bacterium]|nr:hypothetical protein [Candidatus Aminicenantes bacterium]
MSSVKNFYQSIPEQIREWKVKIKDRTFDRKTIFKYINGGAELYLAYDFQQVFARTYSGSGENEIVLDIYDMGSAAEAFGIFTSEREDDEAGIGQGSEYSEGLLRFWKDRFFISIILVGDNPDAGAVIKELAEVVAAAIPSTGPEPVILEYLPQQNLDKKSIRYFHTVLLLDKHYYIADENILNLSAKTHCVLAEYQYPGNNQEPTYLLLIQYETKDQAQKSYENFIKIYMPEARETGLAQMENKEWTMAKIDKNMVKIVFEAPDKNRASGLLSAVKLV